MRVIFLTQYYPPEVGAPQNRLSDLARRLVRMGHVVTVMTAMPSYPAGRIQPSYRGKVYAREQLDGVTIHRSWILATKSLNVPLRLASYLSFVLSSLVAGALCLRRADVLLCESPPLFLGVTGFILARLKRARFVLNIADLWPQSAVAVNVVTNRGAIRLAEKLELFLYRRAHLVTAQTRGIADDITHRMPGHDVRVLTNGADILRFAPDQPATALLDRFDLRERFIVGYAGIHGPAQALESVVDAGPLLANYPDLVLTLFGDGPLKSDLESRARIRHVGNVRFFPLQPAETMPGLLCLWSIGIVPLFNSELGRGALPSKMFEMMAAGLPIVLSAPKGEATALIEESQGGLCVEPENPEALATAIGRLYRENPLREELGRNARAYIARHYDREIIAQRFVSYVMPPGDGLSQEAAAPEVRRDGVSCR